jgi:hypothetical protein
MKRFICLSLIAICAIVFSCSSDSERSDGAYILVRKTGGLYAIYPETIDITGGMIKFFGFPSRLKKNSKDHYCFSDHQNNTADLAFVDSESFILTYRSIPWVKGYYKKNKESHGKPDRPSN